MQAVLGASGDVPADTPTIRGWDFCHGRDLDRIMGSMIHTGFQATSFGQAIEEVNRMVRHMSVSACDPEGLCIHPSAMSARIAACFAEAHGNLRATLPCPRTMNPPPSAGRRESEWT